LSRDTPLPHLLRLPVTGKPSVTLATPLRNEAGVRLGVILAHLNLDRIDQIVRGTWSLGESGETYLVGSLVTKTPLSPESKPTGRNSLKELAAKALMRQ